jgi:hypothetical protein
VLAGSVLNRRKMDPTIWAFLTGGVVSILTFRMFFAGLKDFWTCFKFIFLLGLVKRSDNIPDEAIAPAQRFILWLAIAIGAGWLIFMFTTAYYRIK